MKFGANLKLIPRPPGCRLLLVVVCDEFRF